MNVLRFVLCAWCLASCAQSSAAGPVRFLNQPPASAVNDRLDVPTKPEMRIFARALNVFDLLWVDLVTGSLELRKRVRAKNVNSLDEVPNSTWFQNRIGTRDLSIDEIQVGPNRKGRPGPQLPLTIVSSKLGGNPGFLVQDASKQKYLLKFDFPGAPELDTGAHMIVQRILWACGYNVPEDQIVFFERNQLLLSKDAVVKDAFGTKHPMSQIFVDNTLKLTNVEPGKPIRALLSRFVDGIPVGGASPSGARDDDPNDTVPHQHRRELRGLQPITAWLGHTDVKESNTIDAWTEDPEDPNRHYIIHYLIDFGNALGTMAERERWKAYSFAHSLDWKWSFRSVLSLGLAQRPWDGIKSTGTPGIGLFESEKYNPRLFRTNLPYRPFDEMDRFDGFWGAKLLMRFTRSQLEAVVQTAEYENPKTASRMVSILVARQRKTARYWFQKVAPLDRFQLSRDDSQQTYTLCFDDLMLVYDFEVAPSRVSYQVRDYNHSGKPIGPRRQLAGAKSACITDLQPGPSHLGYRIIRINRVTGKRSSPPVLVHLALGPSAAMRIIGLWRQ